MTLASIVFIAGIIWLAAVVVAITRRENFDDDRDYIADKIVLGPLFLGVLLANFLVDSYLYVEKLLKKLRK